MDHIINTMELLKEIYYNQGERTRFFHKTGTAYLSIAGLSKAVARLKKEGLIYQEKSKKDKREVLFYTTKKGERLAEKYINFREELKNG